MIRTTFLAGYLFFPVASAILAIVCSSVSAVDNSEELRKRFLLEAPKGWAAMETFFSKSEGIVIDTLEPLAGFPDDGWDYGHEAIHEFKRAGENVLHRMREGEHNHTVDVLNPEYAFRINRNDETSPWIIEYAGAKNRIQDRLKFTGQVLHVSSNLNLQTLSWTTSQPGFQLDDVKDVSGDGLIEVVFSSSDIFRKDYVVLGGKVLLDSNHYWCVREYTLDIKLDVIGVVEGKVEYEGEKDGFLFPKKVTQNFSFENGVSKRRTFDFDLYRSAEVLDSEFTLTAFGLSEPDFATAVSVFSPSLVAFNVLAIIILSIGIYLRRKFMVME